MVKFKALLPVEVWLFEPQALCRCMQASGWVLSVHIRLSRISKSSCMVGILHPVHSEEAVLLKRDDLY